MWCLLAGFLPVFGTAPIYGVPSTDTRHRVSPDFYQVAQMHTDGVRRHRVSSPQGIVPATGAAFSGITTNNFLCASLFPHLLDLSVQTVDMYDIYPVVLGISLIVYHYIICQ